MVRLCHLQVIYGKNSRINVSYISLTAHWLNKNFEYKHRVLHCREIEGDHTGQNIYIFIQGMLSNWKITIDSDHLFCETMQETFSWQ